METSILKTIKKLLGIDPAYMVFDQDILVQINSAFMILNQLGLGPSGGFVISDDTAVWSDFLGSTYKDIESVKSYVYLKVKETFDPPSTSFGLSSIKEVIKEYEWRLNVQVDPRL